MVVYGIAALFAVPVGIGLIGVLLPAFGYMPALGGRALSLEPVRALLAEPGLVTSVLLSLASGLITTAVAVVGVALFLAAFYDTAGHRLAQRALAPLLAVPHAAAAFGLAFLIAPSGLIFRVLARIFGFDRPPDLLIIGDPWGLAMMAGLVAKEMPFLILVAFAALPQADPTRRMRLSASLGHGRILGFLLAVWPGVYRQIRLPVLAVAAYASGVVDVALILGPSTPAPLAVRLVTWMNDPDLSLHFMASAGAVLQLLVTGLVLVLWLCGERLAARLRHRIGIGGRRLAEDHWLRLLSAVPVALAGGAVAFGLVWLSLWSIAGFWSFPDIFPPSFNFSTWSRVITSLGGPMATSFIVAIASATAALGLVVVLLEARRRQFGAAAGQKLRLPPLVAALIYLPLIVPQIAFVSGLQVTILALRLEPSILMLSGVHLIFVAPYVALALADPWFALDPRYEQIAASLGHGPIRTLFRVRLPMLTRPVLTALAIGIATSVGQYLPTILIGAGRLPTITTEAVALASGGNRRVIGAYALLQMLLPFLAFSLSGSLPRLLLRRRGAMKPR
ncbi:ABC transporter permease [Jiella sp. MQZ9-1]|uniref:ABC transporter permease n=1 Tax=Jiella flava TaxID=2816857 RepID=A0A939G1C7_9HYPH|nr:ABC transporter permease [Jiella flava]MBO0663347.1 ABC transporter permease [Jiella flava]MCD2471923.1 ABC transporter permease [Jiella flava]